MLQLSMLTACTCEQCLHLLSAQEVQEVEHFHLKNFRLVLFQADLLIFADSQHYHFAVEI